MKVDFEYCDVFCNYHNDQSGLVHSHGAIYRLLRVDCHSVQHHNNLLHHHDSRNDIISVHHRHPTHYPDCKPARLPDRDSASRNNNHHRRFCYRSAISDNSEHQHANINTINLCVWHADDRIDRYRPSSRRYPRASRSGTSEYSNNYTCLNVHIDTHRHGVCCTGCSSCSSNSDEDRYSYRRLDCHTLRHTSSYATGSHADDHHEDIDPYSGIGTNEYQHDQSISLCSYGYSDHCKYHH
jgi:hypothetical protein